MASTPKDYEEILTPSIFGRSSRAHSMSVRSFQSTELSPQAREDLNAELMVNHLRQKQIEKGWVNVVDQSQQGVILRKNKNDFVCKPISLAGQKSELYDHIRQLKTRVAMTIQTEFLTKYLQETQLTYVPYSADLRIQMLDDITDLSRCRKNQMAAFIQEPPMLVVWHDDPELILQHAEDIQSHLIKFIWSNHNGHIQTDPFYEVSLKTRDSDGKDVEAQGSQNEEPRKTVLYQAFLTAATAALTVACLSLGLNKIIFQSLIDHTYVRFALLIFVPAQVWIGWFFFQTIINGVAQVFGPVAQVQENSRGYSSVKPKRLSSNALPHVTIQCPVYKEGLWTVLDPTLASVRAAICTYELQGGTANIFVNDDGMQVISSEDAEARRQYYDDHDIGWVARPKHNPNPKDEKEVPFVRPGKFKKASNMNYAMALSAQVEDRMRLYERPSCWSQTHEDEFYRSTLAEVLREHNGRTLAGGNIRIGDYIVIIDSDTRLPSDAFLDLVSEMEQSPEVGIIQVCSGVMNVTTNFFERGITYFTNLVYTAIQYSVANGDVACFVGHNAIIRWSALQDIRYDDAGIEKYWSELTVSEDFDLALRLQSIGYDIRFCTYYDGGFKEGVSLDVYDELARWEKYAYGCSELVFQPFIYWFTRGPVTPLFRKFITSRISIMAKLTIMSYIGTYYALASAWLLTFVNYFLIGWCNGYLDHYYLNSFNIFFSVVMVFQALGAVSLAILRYRIADRSLISSFLENLAWSPFLSVFLGGVSIHVFQALMCHMFSIDISWGATSKEETKTTFFAELPTILRKFKFSFCYCIFITGGMITMAGIGPLGALVPPLWRITEFVAVFPLSISIIFHFIMPLALNPGLMQFSF